MYASSGQTKLLVHEIWEKVTYGIWSVLTDGQLWNHTMVVDLPNMSVSAPSVNVPCLHMEFKLHVILVLKMKNGMAHELGTGGKVEDELHLEGACVLFSIVCD